LPFWATTLGSEKVRDTVGGSSELEMADVCYVAISVGKRICSTAIFTGDVQIDYLAKVERAVERWEEVGHCSLNAISWWFTDLYILSVVPDNHPEIISWSNLVLGYEGIVPEASH
jgi:hypothetical protein